jgi:hypothetical protein
MGRVNCGGDSCSLRKVNTMDLETEMSPSCRDSVVCSWAVMMVEEEGNLD